VSCCCEEDELRRGFSYLLREGNTLMLQMIKRKAEGCQRGVPEQEVGLGLTAFTGGVWMVDI